MLHPYAASGTAGLATAAADYWCGTLHAWHTQAAGCVQGSGKSTAQAPYLCLDVVKVQTESSKLRVVWAEGGPAEVPGEAVTLLSPCCSPAAAQPYCSASAPAAAPHLKDLSAGTSLHEFAPPTLLLRLCCLGLILSHGSSAPVLSVVWCC